jgi:hypothetical protein
VKISPGKTAVGAIVLVALVAVLAYFSNSERHSGTIGQDKSGRPNDFWFEDYSGDPYRTEMEVTEAAKFDLYKLFPKGAQPEKLVEFIKRMGGNCKEILTDNYVKRYGNALYCRYEYPLPETPNFEQRWIIHIFREHNDSEISKIEIKLRAVAP